MAKVVSLNKRKRNKRVSPDEERTETINVRFSDKEIDELNDAMNRHGYIKKSKFIRDMLFKQLRADE